MLLFRAAQRRSGNSRLGKTLNNQGFTILEVVITLGIIAVISTFALNYTFSAMDRTHLTSLRETGAQLAVAQQSHRHFYGRFAQNVSSSGASAQNQLVFKPASDYSIRVTERSFTGFSATVEPSGDTPAPDDACYRLRVQVDQGNVTFTSFDRVTGQDTSSRCLNQ